MSKMQSGEFAELIGPLGNTWADYLPESGKVALVGGSVGIAPLAALVAEKPDFFFHFYAGFKFGFREKEEENMMLGAAVNAKKIVITAEDGRNALIGNIVDFIFEPQNYDAIFSCGSLQMLKAVKKKCSTKDIKCYLSMESRMACGIGACLGCTVRTKKGNRSCCADGPIFPAEEINFDE